MTEKKLSSIIITASIEGGPEETSTEFILYSVNKYTNNIVQYIQYSSKQSDESNHSGNWSRRIQERCYCLVTRITVQFILTIAPYEEGLTVNK